MALESAYTTLQANLLTFLFLLIRVRVIEWVCVIRMMR